MTFDWEETIMDIMNNGSKDEERLKRDLTAAQIARMTAQTEAIISKTEQEAADAAAARDRENRKLEAQIELDKEKMKLERETTDRKLRIEEIKTDVESEMAARTDLNPIITSAITAVATIAAAMCGTISASRDRKTSRYIADKSFLETMYITDKVLKTSEEDIIPTTSIKAIEDLRKKRR